MLTSDRYQLRIHQADGSIFGIERSVAATPFDPDERRENQRQLEMMYRAGRRTGTVPTIGERKPFAKDLDADLDGRIWVQRRTPSERVAPKTVPTGDGKPSLTVSFREPLVYDAFRTDGTYLGEVTFPKGAEVYAFSGDLAWGTVITDDEVYLVQWRLPGAR